MAKVKSVITPEYISGAFLVVAILFGNFFGFLYNAYLSRKLSLEDFGLISLFGSFVYISGVLTSGLGRTFTHKSAFLFGKYGGPVKEFWTNYRPKLFKISIIAYSLWLLVSPFLMSAFKSESIFPFIIFAPVWIMGIVGSIDSSMLSGTLKFWIVSLLMVIEPIAKFVITVLFVQMGHEDWVYLSIPLSMSMTFLLTYLFVKKMKGTTTKIDLEVVTSFPKKFFATSIVAKFATIVFLSLDLVAAKLFLSPNDAGNYAIVSTVGKMVYFISTLFGQFIVPYASKENGEGTNDNKSFVTIFTLTGFQLMLKRKV